MGINAGGNGREKIDGGGVDDVDDVVMLMPPPPPFPSPASSSSSSEFEFMVSLSPTSRRPSSGHLCPADELFYKGQLLPLHLSPRLSMVRTLLLASSSTSSDSTIASRDSTGSATSSSSSSSSSSSLSAADLLLLRPPAAADEEESPPAAPRRRYLSSFATRFSSVFLPRAARKDKDQRPFSPAAAPPSTAREVIKKYVKKVKPLYDKLSLSSLQHKHAAEHRRPPQKTFSFSIRRETPAHAPAPSTKAKEAVGVYAQYSQSFSGNLSYPRRKQYAGSCPSSMRSSPSHSGLLCAAGGEPASSSMEELQSAILGAIAHCKNSMAHQAKLGKSLALSTS